MNMLNYKGLHGTLERLIVSEERVNGQIEQLIRQNPRIIPVGERPSAEGDELVLDYAGFCEGEQFQGGTAQMQTLTLGSGAFIPGFEEQLVGKNVGDEVDVSVTFPEQYHAENLAGKPAVFKCKIHEIRLRRRYEDDDLFAREICGLKDMAALKDKIRQGLQDYADRQADEDLKLRLLDAAIQDDTAEITPEQLKAAVDQQMDVLEARLNQQGLNLDAYCQFTGKTREQLRQECEPDARKGVLRQRAIEEIARVEQIEADEASVAEAIRDICRQNRMTVEQLMPHIDEAAQTAIVRNVITAKVLDLIRDCAVIEVVEKKEQA